MALKLESDWLYRIMMGDICFFLQVHVTTVLPANYFTAASGATGKLAKTNLVAHIGRQSKRLGRTLRFFRLFPPGTFQIKVRFAGLK
jgi:hypothetical protein